MGKWTNNLFKLIMTPREKAWELYQKYRTLEGKYGDKVLYNYDAKQCALIAVDEMIEEISKWAGGEFQEWEKERWKYLQEVKQEIEKL
jgi:hypothetical protein